MMKRCWVEDPNERPDFPVLKRNASSQRPAVLHNLKKKTEISTVIYTSISKRLENRSNCRDIKESPALFFPLLYPFR